MKSDWKTKKLNEICNVEYGTRVVRKIDSGTIYPVYGGGDKTFSLDRYNREDCFVVARFAMSEQCTRFVKGKFFLNDSGLSVSPKNTNEISQDFLNMQLFYLNDHIYSLARGTAQKNLDVPAFKEMLISYPDSLLEQQHIVNILDKAFEKIEKAKQNTQKNLQNSKNQYNSYLNIVFSNDNSNWIKTELSSVLQKTETINPTKTPDMEFMYVDVSSVNKDTLIIENTSILKGKNAPSRARKLIKTNDIIFATVRPTLRRIAIVPEKLNNQVCSTGYFVLRANEKLLNRLVYYFLQTENFIKKMESLQRGANYPAVTDGDIKRQFISFPKNILEQEILIKKLEVLYDKSKKLEYIYQQKINYLEELKKSILNKAFNGDL